MSSSSKCCQRCLTQRAEVIEKWPGETNMLRFCSRRCLEEYKLDILKKETMFCLTKTIPEDRFQPTVERSTVKRRVNETGGEKRRKKRKEPRPHPSYRLNKRYWDDIRAGRRSHDVPSVRSSPQRTALHPPNPVGLTAFPTPVPHLSFPLISTGTTPTLAPPPCIPYQFPSVPPNNSLFTNALAGRIQPKAEPEDIIDVTSCDDDNIKLATSFIEEPSLGIQIPRMHQRESDAVVDEIANEIFQDLVVTNSKKCADAANIKMERSMANTFTPIPIPIPVPILIPLSEAFILKHFARNS